MNLSYLILMFWVFLMGTAQLAWWAVDNRLLGFVALAAAVIFLLESLSVISWRIPVKRAP